MPYETQNAERNGIFINFGSYSSKLSSKRPIFIFQADLCREQTDVLALGFFSFFSQGSHLQWVTSVTQWQFHCFLTTHLPSLHCLPNLTVQLSLGLCPFPQLVNSQPWRVFVCYVVLLFCALNLKLWELFLQFPPLLVLEIKPRNTRKHIQPISFFFPCILPAFITSLFFQTGSYVA